VWGGIILDPKGKQEITFAWSLGETTSNQVEALALLQGLMLLKQQGI